MRFWVAPPNVLGAVSRSNILRLNFLGALVELSSKWHANPLAKQDVGPTFEIAVDHVLW